MTNHVCAYVCAICLALMAGCSFNFEIHLTPPLQVEMRETVKQSTTTTTAAPPIQLPKLEAVDPCVECAREVKRESAAVQDALGLEINEDDK